MLFLFHLFPQYSPNNPLKIPSPSQLFHLQIQSMSTLKFSPLILGFFLWLSSIPPSLSQTCNSQKFTSSNLYSHCVDLPTLSSYLHFSFNSTNSTLAVAFRTSSVPNGWVSWAINPKAASMAGAQALVAFKDSKGSLAVKTYNISGYSPDSVAQSKLDFEVWDARAEDQNGVTTVFAKIKIPADLAAKGSVNQVWQVGPSVDDKGILAPHAMNPANLNAKATLDLNGGQTVTTAGGVDSKTRKRNIHGVLNAVSWGILFPLGIIIARYLRTFQSADPIWFYLHVGCQISAYAIGVAGWATGIKLGGQSKGITWSSHRNIGIALFAMATLQIFALFMRPKKDHKYRFYWNVYHHGVGYAILVLGVLNVFKGLDILNPEEKWKSGYIVAISVLGGVAVLLEVITWIVVLRRSNKSTKPYGGYNGNGREQPLHA